MSKYDEKPPLNNEDAKKMIIGVLINMVTIIMTWVILISVWALNFFI